MSVQIPRNRWTWDSAFECNCDETQFLIVSKERNEVLVAREEHRWILPGILDNEGVNSYVDLAHPALKHKYPVFPVALLWSDCEDRDTDEIYMELKKAVMLMSWTDNDIRYRHEEFEWKAISSELSIYHYFDEARSSIMEEFERLQSFSNSLVGMPWNSFKWSSEVSMTISNVLNTTVTFQRDYRFTPRGVVLEFQTSEDTFFLKACNKSSCEPFVTHFASRELGEFFEQPIHVDKQLQFIITKDHGPSVSPLTDNATEEECGSLLASMQIASIEHVGVLLSAGVMDARPCSISDRVAEISRHPELSWVKDCNDPGFESVVKLSKNLPQLENYLLNRLESVGNFPPVLLHNDIASGNIFRTDSKRLVLFDLGFCAIGHPFMDMSFRLLSSSGRKRFVEAWREAGQECDDTEEIFRKLTALGLTIRLLQVLNSLSGARQSEKLEIVPLIVDTCDLLLMYLPSNVESQTTDSTSSSGSGRILYVCRTCGHRFRIPFNGSASLRCF